MKWDLWIHKYSINEWIHNRNLKYDSFEFIIIYAYAIFHYWIQYHEFRKLNSHLFSVMNSYYEIILMKSNSWIQIEYNEFLYLNSYIYEFIYEFRILSVKCAFHWNTRISVKYFSEIFSKIRRISHNDAPSGMSMQHGHTFEFIYMNSYIHEFIYSFHIWIQMYMNLYMNSYNDYMNSYVYEFIYMNSYVYEFIYIWIHVWIHIHMNSCMNSYKLWIHMIFSYMTSYVSWIHIWIRVYQGPRCQRCFIYVVCYLYKLELTWNTPRPLTQCRWPGRLPVTARSKPPQCWQRGSCILRLSICASRELLGTAAKASIWEVKCSSCRRGLWHVSDIDRVVTVAWPLLAVPKAGFEPGSPASQVVDCTTKPLAGPAQAPRRQPTCGTLVHPNT